MSEIAKCPHCSQLITKLKVVPMEAEYSQAGSLRVDSRKCWVYICPSVTCGKILSIQYDPIAQRDETAVVVKKQLGRA
jgi:hypothetical protein